MNGLDKIHDHIRADARAEIDSILAEAGKRAEIAAAGYEAQARQMTADAAEKRRQTGAEQLQRHRRSAEMARRQQLLRAKQQCIDEVFSRALAQLQAMPAQDYAALLGRLAAENGAGCEELILSPEDRQRVGAAVLSAANAGGASFTLSEETRALQGGLILKNGPVETDCTFATALHGLRQTCAADVARILFE